MEIKIFLALHIVMRHSFFVIKEGFDDIVHKHKQCGRKVAGKKH